MNRTDTMRRCTLCVFLILSYIIACSVNFMAAMKFPDGELQTSHAIASLLFWLSLLAYATYGRSHFGLFIKIGMLSGLLIFPIASLQYIITDFTVLDIAFSVQYPLFFTFVIPLFGLNVHTALDYGTYALVSSSLYFVAFVAYRLGPRFRISQKN